MFFFEICWYIVAYDLWFYISHIGLHHMYIYKMIHKHHHSVDPILMIYSDTYVGHYLESGVQGLGVFIPLIWIECTTSFYIVLLLINIRGMMRHDVRCIPWIGNHHILHHKYPKYNFGEYWLDYFCGTQCPYLDEYTSGLIYL